MNVIYIPDLDIPDLDLSSEDMAMLQAIYSRSDTSVIEHMKDVKKRGSAKFMETYYLNYGHKSIGDCAFATIFCEDVSFLATKAIQDSPLYNGQESSTRYIDFRKRPFIDPINTPESKAILEGWRSIYIEVYEAIVAKLNKELEKEDQTLKLKNAIHSRACDIARGFLPLGATTQLSYTTTLRQFGDRLALLNQHPLQEIKDIAKEARAVLYENFPSSFKKEDYADRQEYYKSCSKSLHYSDLNFFIPDGYQCRVDTKNQFGFKDIDPNLYRNRPPKAELPRILSNLAHFDFKFMMDYGSFRDIQRHRNGYCPIPFVKGLVHLHPWYTNHIKSIEGISINRIGEHVSRTNDFIYSLDKNCSTPEGQYYYPLAQLVPVELDYDLCQCIYVAELRSSKHVHPTARQVALNIIETVRQYFPQIPLHVDETPMDNSLLAGFNLDRGKQTFKSQV